jgi:hypothetical protein
MTSLADCQNARATTVWNVGNSLSLQASKSCYLIMGLDLAGFGVARGENSWKPSTDPASAFSPQVGQRLAVEW